MLAVERMIRQNKQLPKAKADAYSDKWAYVAMEIGRRKFKKHTEATANH